MLRLKKVTGKILFFISAMTPILPSAYADEMNAFCYFKMRANEGFVCSQIESTEGRNFSAACNDYARSRRAVRYGNYQHTNIEALSQRQNTLCHTIIGPILGPIQRRYECASEQICPEPMSSSIRRDSLGVYVDAIDESRAVDKCVSEASAQYLEAMREAGNTPTCYVRPVVISL